MLTNYDIEELAGSYASYSKGCNYFHQGRVHNLKEFDSGRFEADVVGKKRYRTTVAISYDHHIGAHSCTCPAHSNFDGACKHVIAVLKAVQDVQEVQLKAKKKAAMYAEPQSITEYEAMKRAKKIDPAMQSLLKYFEKAEVQMVEPEKDTELTSLVPLLVLSHGAYRSDLSLEFSIGKGKQYVVKDLTRLAIAMIEKSNMHFGREFDLDVKTVQFDDFSQKIMDWVVGIYHEEEQLSGDDPYNLPSFHGKRQLTMTEMKMDQLATFLNGGEIKLKIAFENKVHRVRFVEGQPRFTAELKTQSDMLYLSLLPEDKSDLLQMLPGSMRYLYHNSRIYRLGVEEEQRLAPFIDCINSSQRKPVSMPLIESGRIMGSLVPALKRIATVHLESELEEKYEREPLLAHVYLDRYYAQTQTGISARVEFHYGERRFCGVTQNKLNAQVKSDRILIRQPQEENALINFLERYDFKPYKDMMIVSDEDAVYDFCSFGLQRLQGLAEVYATEDFDSIKIRRSVKITAGIRLSDSGLLEMQFQQSEFSPQEMMEILSAYRQKKKYHKLKNGTFMALDTDELGAVSALMEGLGFKAEDMDGRTLELPRYRAMYADALLKSHKSLGIHKSSGFKKMVHDIAEPIDLEYPVPEGINGNLREYQIVGFRWLKSLAAYGFGGILADDMGLGKTLQVIAFLLSEKGSTQLKNLVVAPTSLIYNWLDEIQRFAPSLKAVVIAGNPEERSAQLASIEDADVLITSYGMLKRDMSYYKEQHFQYCIIDEAQHIKNPKTLNAKSVKTLKANGTFALTGTPIENSLTELWSIFDFLMPGYLYTHNRFFNHFEKPIVLDQDQRALANLSYHIKPFMLRRMKNEVLTELPDKIETRLACAMTLEQERLYKAHLARAQKEVTRVLEKSGLQKGQIEILALLTRLRQICCHPAMFLDDYIHGSGKLEALEELLDDAVSSGHRVLVFSQFTTMLKLIQDSLVSKGLSCYYLDGGTAAEKRMQMVRDFNNGSRSIFLISLKAGGTGLNLTGADVVVHYDPWWNPAVEDQATDRAYRMGQDKRVQVYRLITRNTLEEKIYELQQRKRELVDSVIQPGESFLHKMSEEDIRNLFV